MFKRLQELKTKIMAKHKTFPNVIIVETWIGISREQAQLDFEKANNLPHQAPENYIFVTVPSDAEIQNRIKNNDVF